MCGIIAICSFKNVLEEVMSSLSKLEYRGYDSAGIAAFSKGGIYECKSLGRIENLRKKLEKSHVISNTAIGHTRWATHGKVSIENTHPIVRENIAIVHNGTIENHFEIKKELQAVGIQFFSDTDTEVLAALIEYELSKNNDLSGAVIASIKRLQGNFAFALISQLMPGSVLVAKNGMNLVIGIGNDFTAISSDSNALPANIINIAYLEDGNIAIINKNHIDIFDLENKKIDLQLLAIDEYEDKVEHHINDNMRCEIDSQPRIVKALIERYKDANLIELIGLDDIDEIFIIACGSSYFSAMTAKYWIEELANVKVTVSISSEFNVRPPIEISKKSIYIFISQSGETADTLSALKYVKQNRDEAKTVGIVNNTHSSISRYVDKLIPMMVGPEIAVAATKSFYAQMVILFILGLKLAVAKRLITSKIYDEYIGQISNVPLLMSRIIGMDNEINKFVSRQILQQKSLLYFGKGILYPIAMEGALKIKEVAYIPAEGIPSGELKHGTIALVDENTMAIALVMNGKLFKKTITSLEEVLARSSNLLLITDNKDYNNSFCKNIIRLPEVEDELLAPFTFTLTLQLIAYHAAVGKGCDVDKPRNLAKSVTVE